MSTLTELPEPAQRYLLELKHELRFEQKYADNICLEISEHFYEAVECSNDTPEKAALRVTQRFGSPQNLAAEFAVVLITRKLRNTLFINLGIIIAIVFAVFTCLTNHHGGPAVITAALSGCVTWAGLLAIHRNQLEGVRLYHWLCTPMIACQTTSCALLLALLWNIFSSPNSSLYYHSFESAAVVILAARMLHLKLRSRSMCALWKKTTQH
ncbi:hypothetical protein [Pantoea sp. At-9b]|uniref:hypothetical protein n=1 Tax=Pantoea sp. (strain At-9b) TaxID=592316 RepID=UPI0001B3E162|nr:hypothetical protein [Pantoea sp. At-9b]ADU72575.1 hypothetical protein Pat9b_4605 [Pantoea sp. At-9b]